MKKTLFFNILFFFILISSVISCKNENDKNEDFEEENLLERYEQEFNMTKNPTTGRIPEGKLLEAIIYTQNLKNTMAFYQPETPLWEERGPYFDSCGPQGNRRGGGVSRTEGYTSGRINSLVVDALDATGNTVVCGGVSGGIWKTTNFLSTQPNWTPVNDFMSNLSISSICQDPSNKNIMYAATGEPFFNQGAVRGTGVFKSTDRGNTWILLPSTINVTRSFKIECDANGIIYYATGVFGLLRSSNGGTSWTTITPSSTAADCSDFEISSTGKLHVSMGFYGSSIFYRFTNNPATVTSSTWSRGSGLRNSSTTTRRLELACQADVLYAITTNSANNVDSCYKSVNGGETWQIMNRFVGYTTGVANGQGWVNLVLEINPNNTDEIIMGGLDGYRSYNSGESITRFSYWVNATPYVHADHHYIKWWNAGGEERVLIAGDGGLFYSSDGASTFTDKNYNLRIKQFYSCAIHPNESNYFLAGAQDNGSHRLTQPGLSYSTEVTGGDGCFVFIDQADPQFQYTTYVNNNLRKSLDGGLTFTNHKLSNGGAFVSPMDYDHFNKKMYCSEAAGSYIRWENPTAVGVATVTTFNLTGSLNGTPTALTVSPYSAIGNTKLFIGTNSGNIYKIENANSVVNATQASANLTEISSGMLPTGTIKCVAVGTNENNLIVTYSNYGIDNVWVTTDGGTIWTSIDGDLPNMPVRWAAFQPGNNNKILLATEAGVFYNSNVLSGTTQWLPSPSFPLVRTDMFRVRTSDQTIVAATYGRGLWTANLNRVLPLKNINLQVTSTKENTAMLEWKGIDASPQIKYAVQASNDGINFKEIEKTNFSKTNASHSFYMPFMYYRIIGSEPNAAAIVSNTVQVKSISKVNKNLVIKLNNNPVLMDGVFNILSSTKGNFSWQIVQLNGAVMQQGKGVINANENLKQNFNTSQLKSGTYVISVRVNGNIGSEKFIKL